MTLIAKRSRQKKRKLVTKTQTLTISSHYRQPWRRQSPWSDKHYEKITKQLKLILAKLEGLETKVETAIETVNQLQTTVNKLKNAVEKVQEDAKQLKENVINKKCYFCCLVPLDESAICHKTTFFNPAPNVAVLAVERGAKTIKGKVIFFFRVNISMTEIKRVWYTFWYLHFFWGGGRICSLPKPSNTNTSYFCMLTL